MAPQPLSPAIAVAPATSKKRVKIDRPSVFPRRRRIPASGSSRSPNRTGGNVRWSSVAGSSRATADGVWIANVVAGSALFAGNDQVVPVSEVHADGEMLAVAPEGRPVKDKVIGAGKIVPLVGRMVSG